MEILEKALQGLKIEYTAEMLGKFEVYMEEILKWNEKVNLTAIKEREDFIKKHFIDSVVCASEKEFKGSKSIIDVGTGAGFPGVPLAILHPEKEFLLMDSLNKRLKIINEICKKMEIKNVRTFHGRAEEMGKNPQHREAYDLCVSRAVANFATLSEYCLPLVKPGGYFLAYKGPDAEREIAEAGKAVALLGGKVTEIRKETFSEKQNEHCIVYTKKIKTTPAKYPRKAGIPSKEPLK